MTGRHPLWRSCVAELLGTGMLTLAVVGSGIAASQLSKDHGIQLAINASATGLTLYVIIVVVAPVSGAHLNPVVSLVDVALGSRPWKHLAGYLPAQLIGGALGVILANTIFGKAPVSLGTADRLTVAHLAAEVVATAGLVLVIFTLARGPQHRTVPVAVAAYITAAYFFTSSTSFANPAVTLGRILTDTFTGITPASALAFLPAQLIGAAVGAACAVMLFPSRRVVNDGSRAGFDRHERGVQLPRHTGSPIA
ncbi:MULTISPECIES: aquaporin [Humibacter]|jgi:arsenate reductase|uniref:Aquaporin family protein n=1 Tax=Humibacter ginsenosidimutans TaxID=2599293 RepID=A0A5B8M8H5_9MICO|nr:MULTISPECIES: MIP/aquaporin family protein [Humibacter]QDZ15935.1 aquaporin family protein [Humibacter ginsenosidimutans]